MAQCLGHRTVDQVQFIAFRISHSGPIGKSSTVHTRASLFTKQYKLVQVKVRDTGDTVKLGR